MNKSQTLERESKSSPDKSASPAAPAQERPAGNPRPPRTQRRSYLSLGRLIWLLPALVMALLIVLSLTPATRWVYATGYSMTSREVEIRPSVEGAIDQWLVASGSEVQAGDLLIVLKSEVQRAAYDQAVHDLNARREQLEQMVMAHEVERARRQEQIYQAERSFELARQHAELMSEGRGFAMREIQDAMLRKQVAASRLVELSVPYDELWAQQQQVLREQIHAAQTTIALRQAELNLREIRASIPGTVYFNRFEPGEHVKTEHVLGQIFDESQWVAKLRVGERDLAHVTLAQQVQLSLASYPTLRFGYLSGQVSRILPVVTPQATGDGVFYVEAAITEVPAGMTLHPGMTVTGYIQAGQTNWLMKLLGW